MPHESSIITRAPGRRGIERTLAEKFDHKKHAQHNMRRFDGLRLHLPEGEPRLALPERRGLVLGALPRSAQRCVSFPPTRYQKGCAQSRSLGLSDLCNTIAQY